MTYGWTKEQIKAAIDRCERDVEEMIRRHATPGEIEARRQGLDAMRKWMERAEK